MLRHFGGSFDWNFLHEKNESDPSTFHKGTMQIFINGQLVSTKAATTSSIPVCPLAQVIIGGWWQAVVLCSTVSWMKFACITGP